MTKGYAKLVHPLPLLILLSALVLCSRALILEREYTFDASLASVTYHRFKFKKGGNISFVATKVTPKYDKFESRFYAFEKSVWKNVNPCINSEYQDRALFMFNITGTGASFSYVIEDPGVYYLVLTTCSSTINPVEITSETTLMNPGAAKYLSADDQYRPYMYDVFVGVWFVLLVLWIGNWAYVMLASKNKSQVKKKLHLILSGYVVLKMLSTLFLLCYWNVQRNTGNPLNGWPYLYYALRILETVGFYGALLLISSGWDIINDNLLPRRWQYAAGAIGAYGIILILTLYVDILYFFFSIAEMVVLFIIIVMIGSRSTTTLTIIYDTISAIKRAYRRNSVEGEDGSGSSEPQVVSASEVVVPNSVKKRKKHLKRQFKMISVFRYIFIGYLLGKIVVLVILMIGVDEWVGDVLYQVLDVAVAVAVGITFRLHKVKANGNYFLLENEFDDDEDGGGSYYENDDECASNDSSSKGSVELESQR